MLDRDFLTLAATNHTDPQTRLIADALGGKQGWLFVFYVVMITH